MQNPCEKCKKRALCVRACFVRKDYQKSLMRKGRNRDVRIRKKDKEEH